MAAELEKILSGMSDSDGSSDKGAPAVSRRALSTGSIKITPETRLNALIVLANRANGPEQVMQLVELRAPEGFSRIEDVLTPDELEGTAAAYKNVAGFDRDALNARASIV